MYILILCCSHHYSNFGAKKIKSLTVSIVSPSTCYEIMGPKAMIFVLECRVLNHLFHFPVSLLSRGLFSPSSLSAIWVLPSVYVRLLLFLPAILIQVCVSSSLAFHTMYTASNLNKQGCNSEPVHSCMSGSRISLYP